MIGVGDPGRRRPGRGRWRSRWPVRRAGLATRFGALGVLTVLLASLVLGLVGARIVQGVSDSDARRVLRMVADADAERVAAGLPAKPDGVNPTALDRVNVQRAALRRPRDQGGEPRITGAALAREALSADQVDRLLRGSGVSTVIRRDGVAVFVEARPTPEGAIIVAQRRPDGLTQAVADQALPVWAWSAAGVAGVGALLAGLSAWLTGRPLRRLAAAAGDLAQGRRDVALPQRGPAEVAALAGEFNALAAALARAEARQREFLMSISHDLRTPLTTLKGYAETLADPASPSDAALSREAGAVMLAEASRLERMVADLLTLARLEADEVELRVGPVDLGALLRETAQAWSARCAAAGLAVTVQVGDLADPRPVVAADPERLRQVLDNLLENAVRVCPPGAPLVLAARPGPERWFVAEVRDGGPGLTDDDLTVAFDRGALRERYRGRREVGTGLGLTLVDRLITRMGGTVTAGRAPEGGVAFTILLPAHPEPPADPEPPAHPAHSAQSATDSPPPPAPSRGLGT